MVKNMFRLLLFFMLIYAGGIISQLWATEGVEKKVILHDKTVPAPGVSAPLDLGPSGCAGCVRTTTQPPTAPKPTGYLSDGRPYYGTGSKDDPFRDYPDVRDPQGGLVFGTIPAPKPPEPEAADTTKVTVKKTTPTPEPPEKTKPVREMTVQETLNKKWEFWQDQYRSWENDLLAPLDQCLRNMKEAEGKIAEIRRDYERLGLTPPPGDVTRPTYPPQSPKQVQAVNLYQSYLQQLETTRKAEENARNALRITRESATFLEVPAHERAAREAAERQAAAERERLQRIRERWRDTGFHDQYGPLPTSKTMVPDPSHQPKDPRKPKRQVDQFEHKIKSGM